MDARQLTEQLPYIFQFILPGYIFFFMIAHSTNKKLETVPQLMLLIIMYSAILKYIFSFMNMVIFHLEFNIVLQVLILTITSIFLGYIVTKKFIHNNTKFVKYLLGNNTAFSSVFSDALDKEKGNWIRIYFDGGTTYYQGKISLLSNDNNSWVILNCFEIFGPNEYPVCVCNSDDVLSNLIAVNLEKSDYVEFIYEPKSSKYKFLSDSK